MNSKRTLLIVIGFTTLIVIIGALTYLVFDRADGSRAAQAVIDVDLEPLSYPPRKRLANLDALFRDATRGEKIDVDLKYSSELLVLTVKVDVRQGSCELYTSDGCVRFEPAGVIVAQIESSGLERRYTFLGEAQFFIRLIDDTYEDASAQVELQVNSEDMRAGSGSIDSPYCRQSIPVRKRLFSHVARLTFMLSEDFQGEIHDCDVSLPK